MTASIAHTFATASSETSDTLGARIPGLNLAINSLLHLLLVGAMALFVYTAVREVLRTQHDGEKRMKALAVFAGALIVVASQATGTSYADFMLGALGGTKPLTFGVFGLVAPAAAGVALAWYFVRKLDRSEIFATRLLMMIGMLAVTQFAVMYGVAVGEEGFALGQASIPNVAFVVGLFLYMLFNYDPATSNRSQRVGLLDRLRGRRPSAPSSTKTFVGE